MTMVRRGAQLGLPRFQAGIRRPCGCEKDPVVFGPEDGCTHRWRHRYSLVVTSWPARR